MPTSIKSLPLLEAPEKLQKFKIEARLLFEEIRYFKLALIGLGTQLQPAKFASEGCN